MELTRTDVVFSRLAMVLFMWRNKSSRNDLKLHGTYFWKILKYWRKNQGKGGHHLSTRVGGVPAPLGAPPCLVGPLELHRPQLQLHIFVFGEKKIGEKDSLRFTIRNSLGRANLESVRGSREGNPSPPSSSTFLHHQFHRAHRRA